MIRRIVDFFKRNRIGILAGAASGCLVGSSWIPFPPWALVFAYSPLFLFIEKNRSSLKQIFLAAWVCQLFLSLIGFHWIAYVSHEFGFIPWFFSILILILFSSAMHLYIPLALTISAKVSEKFRITHGASLFLSAGFLSLFEQFWPSIFAWNMAYPLLWAQSSFTQLADTIGFYGLSWLLYLSSALIAYFFISKNKFKKINLALSVSMALTLAYWWGLQKKEFWKATDAQLNVLVAQANIGNTEKIYAERGQGFQQFIVNEFFNLTRESLAKFPKTDLILWPESAFPDHLNSFAKDKNYPQQFFKFIAETNKIIMTGAYSKDPPGKAYRDDYNGVFLLNSDGTQVGEPYHKTQLLIFGEYIPFGHEIPWLAKVNPGGIGWGRGQGPQVWQLNGHKWGPQVCYESLDPMFSAELAKKGAEILFNVTNDSWFGPRFEPYQHLYMTLARGLETRRPMVRSTNTGISSAILADGSILEQSPLYQKWAGMFEVKYMTNPPLTFYSQYGQFLPLFILFLITLVAVGGRKRE